MTIKAIDLFAGAGGFTLSAIEAGVDVLAAIEFDQAAADTYKYNFLNHKKIDIDLRAGPDDGDITNISPSDLKKSLGLRKGSLDLILGGPPCQGFSTHRIKDAGVDDPRNQLLLRYFEFVHEFKPKAFLVENVAGLLWKRHQNYLQTFIKKAEEEGYIIKFCDTLNAKDYGVPQNRKRVFIFGIRKNLNNKGIQFPPAATHHSPASGLNPKWVSASKVFEKIPERLYKKYWEDYFSRKTKLTQKETYSLLESLNHSLPVREDDPCNVHMQPTDKMAERFSDTPLNGSRIDAGEKHRLKCHSNGYEGHKDVYGRIFIHQPSNTITTGCNNPSKGRFVHPWKNHGITLRHAARLQTFPDWFIFTGNTSEQAKQIGNAVPIELGKALISSITEHL